MQQICRRTVIPKYDFNKVVKQLYWNHSSTWVFSCKLSAYNQNIFSSEHPWRTASVSGLVVDPGFISLFTLSSRPPIYGSSCSRVHQVKFLEDSLLSDILPNQTIQLQTFYRLSSTNFTWSITEIREMPRTVTCY